MKIRVDSASRAQVEQFGDRLLVLEIVEQQAHAFEVAQHPLVEQIGLAADDQHGAPGRVLAPHGDAAFDQVAARRVERGVARGDLGAHQQGGIGQRPAGKRAR